MRFTAQVIQNSSGQTVHPNVNATGELEPLDQDHGFFGYNITFENTENLSDVNFVSNNDYRFSDDITNFPSSVPSNFIYKETYNLTNTEPIYLRSFSFLNEPKVEGNSFSFRFNLSNTTNLNFENETNSFLVYKPWDNANEKEIVWSIVNKSNQFAINCPVKESVYTFLNTIEIKIPQKESTKRLRFLADSENSTFYSPSETEGNIQLEYEPDIHTLGRRASKNKGLSGGAIAAIILATIAAIVAVGIAIFFLNRRPANPPVKPVSELQLQNSSAKIQS